MPNKKTASSTKKPKVQGRSRIFGFYFKGAGGKTQALYENDFDSRYDFYAERARFKRQGKKIQDLRTSTPYKR